MYKITGNVGIGTATPGAKLEVGGTGRFGGNLEVNASLSVTGGGSILISNGGLTANYAIASIFRDKEWPNNYYLDPASTSIFNPGARHLKRIPKKLDE